MAYKQRIARFYELLYGTKNDIQDNFVNIHSLREVCFENGCPDEDKHIRSIVWKLLLGYLPANRNDWDTYLSEKRQLYRDFVFDYMIEDNKLDQSNNDHPLNPDPNSNWKKHHWENEMLSQIIKDVRRLYPDMSFFQQSIVKKFSSSNCDIVGRANLDTQSVDVVKDCFGVTERRHNKLSSCPQISQDDEECHKGIDEEFHWQIVGRILFLYAKLNPGQGYVQGMNEIIGPIYYVFANDPKQDWSTETEADTFWCFTSLMSEIRDIFNKHIDSDPSSGIVSLMTRLLSILGREDSQLAQHINLTLGIKPHFYAFRWITLLLSQEFSLPDLLRLWDYLFSDERRFEFLLKLCCSMILIIRNELLSGDFASNLKLLQNFPDSIESSHVVARAKAIILASHHQNNSGSSVITR